jgi:hypothetical protein
MKTIAVQYLENGPGIAEVAPAEARARLRGALDQLPISYVLLGWNLPASLVEACREVTSRAQSQLYLWHPLLTGDGVFRPRPEFQVVGLDGARVPGYRGMPEFTFVCPNRPGVGEAVLSHLHDVIRQGVYQGIFLDRVRYPSPAADPACLLACFCDGCHRAAAAEGLDLEAVRRAIGAMAADPERTIPWVQAILGFSVSDVPDPELGSLIAFLDFRTRNVTRMVKAAADLIHAEGLAVGLDCFSPALVPLVGQDLAQLCAHSEWVKIMSYGHTLGPAGLPFELLEVISWLVEGRSMGESEALRCVSRAVGLELPSSCGRLRAEGLPPEALAAEVRRARAAGVNTLLPGVELVEIEGVTHLTPTQIAADLQAFGAAGADGLVLSWDLWHMPPRRLELVREIVGLWP